MDLATAASAGICGGGKLAKRTARPEGKRLVIKNHRKMENSDRKTTCSNSQKIGRENPVCAICGWEADCCVWWVWIGWPSQRWKIGHSWVWGRKRCSPQMAWNWTLLFCKPQTMYGIGIGECSLGGVLGFPSGSIPSFLPSLGPLPFAFGLRGNDRSFFSHPLSVPINGQKCSEQSTSADGQHFPNHVNLILYLGANYNFGGWPKIVRIMCGQNRIMWRLAKEDAPSEWARR